ncbi:MAG: hypothetical protein IJM62_00715 [Lachnospiraceae bacterium]|nr:hypothetical protein [Lachnospiraceae bacterium]
MNTKKTRALKFIIAFVLVLALTVPSLAKVMLSEAVAEETEAVQTAEEEKAEEPMAAAAEPAAEEDNDVLQAAEEDAEVPADDADKAEEELPAEEEEAPAEEAEEPAEDAPSEDTAEPAEGTEAPAEEAEPEAEDITAPAGYAEAAPEEVKAPAKDAEAAPGNVKTEDTADSISEELPEEDDLITVTEEPKNDDTVPEKITVHITNILYNTYASVNGHAVAYENTFDLIKGQSKGGNGLINLAGGRNRTAGGLGANYKFLNVFVLKDRTEDPEAADETVYWETADEGDTVTKVGFSSDGTTITVTMASGEVKTYDARETEVYISPVYKRTIDWYLIYNYTDNISTGSGSWSNLDFVVSYSHKFKDPSGGEDISHNRFVNWWNEETGDTYEAGDTFTYEGAQQESGSTKTINVFAMWQPSVTVEYYVDGVLTGQRARYSLVNSVEDYEGVTVYDYVPEYEGAEFKGWYDEEGNRLDDDKVFDAPEITYEKTDQYIEKVYAEFTTTYTVEHYLEELDGTFTLKEDATDEFEDVVGEEVTAEAKEFEGFTFDETVEGTEQTATLRVGTVLKLYYTRNSYKVTYEYTGDTIPDGAEEQLPAEATYKYEEEVPAAAVPEVTGYTFIGWEGEVETMPAEDVTVTGSWEINKYTVTWVDYDGNVLEVDEKVPYGTMPEYNGSGPERESDGKYNYTFIGWDPEIVEVTEDATYTAQYEADEIPETETETESETESETETQPETKKPGGNVPTGDSSDPGMMTLIMISAAAVAALMVIRKRKTDRV